MNSPNSILKLSAGLLAGLLLVACSQPVAAAIITIEPDDYTTGTIISTIQPGLLLRVYDSDLNVYESIGTVPIRSTSDNHASTGARVFSRSGISSFSDTRQLGIDFATPTDFISIDFIGSSSIVNETGILEIYNTAGVLLDTYTTAALGDNVVETMSFTRGTQDIKFARAYTAPGVLTLGRLDDLSYNNLHTIPEPAALALVALGMLIACGTLRRSAK